MEGWKTRIDAIAGKAKKTFVVANNHFEGKAAVNALHLKHMLTGRAVEVPDTLLRKYWERGEIAAKENRVAVASRGNRWPTYMDIVTLAAPALDSFPNHSIRLRGHREDPRGPQHPYFQPGAFAHCWKHVEAGSSVIGNVVAGRWPSIRWV
jgi:hypothetical protein